MPVMNGNQLIAYLVNQEVQPVIMVLTRYDNTELIVDIMKQGVFDYLTVFLTVLIEKTEIIPYNNDQNNQIAEISRPRLTGQ